MREALKSKPVEPRRTDAVAWLLPTLWVAVTLWFFYHLVRGGLPVS
jgi:hypothetical protein